MDKLFEALNKPSKPLVQDFNGVFEPIVPFDQYDTPLIPTTLLPPIIGDFVENVAEVLSVPPAMPFMAALGILSAAVAKKYVVSPKPDWREPINIYCQIAMQPASNKSQTLKYLKSPIDEWEEKESQRVAPLREKALTDIKLLQTELTKHYNVVKGKKSKVSELDDAKNAVSDLESKIQDMKEKVPVLPQIYTTDATPEAIADLLHEQGGRLGIISDEGGITEVLAGLYNSGNANIDIILKGIDGGATRIKRANKDYRLNPYLTVLLLIQPQVLTNMADKKAFTGNGALERYLYVLPSGNVGYRTFSETKINDFVNTRYSDFIFNMLAVPVPDMPRVIELETPAKVAFHTFRQEVERELRPDGKLYICCGWGGKLAGYTLRLAGLLHVATHDDIDHLIIQKVTMQNAISLAKLLMEHAVAAYNLMGADGETKDAKELAEWLKTQSTPQLTKSTIINAMRNRQMGKKERLAKAIANLSDRNILSVPHADITSKKHTDIYFINPDFYLK